MNAEDGSDDSGEAQEGRPSKSARKRDAASLQDLGVELAALPEPQIAALDLPDNLLAALRDLKRLPSHGAQLRQRQYIGKLMRKIDPEPLRRKLAERKLLHDAEIRRFQLAERWRDRLLEEPATALPALLEAYPAADRAALSRLLERAQREQRERRAPAAARELFALIKGLIAGNP
jgi:ribosome-associated protein